MEEFSSLILRQLKEDAESYLDEEITEAVISVPTYSDDMQCKVTEAAMTMVGLSVERLINESTTTILAYGLRNKGDGHQFLVLDLGDGTFDVSILKLFDNVMEVRASARDNFSGGEDIVDILTGAHCLRRDLPENIERREPTLQRHLCIEAECARRILSVQDEATLSVKIEKRQYY